MQKGLLMFKMNNVGRKISELRKQHNMTQLELADKMEISFQAVSNWERGNSMPDISKLPELAALFEVTIDELLGENSKVIDGLMNGDVKELLEQNDIAFEDIVEIAPMLKPDQVDEIFEEVKNENLQDIKNLLPFVSSDIINALSAKAAEEGSSPDLKLLEPFTGQDALNDIARKMIAESKSIADIVPFVSRDIVSELADMLYEQSGIAALSDIIPFIPGEQLQKIAEKEFASNGLHHFDNIAPFLNRSYLNDLAKRAIERDGIKAISNIAPFLDKQMLSAYVKEKYL